jgi:hypothetical protein
VRNVLYDVEWQLLRINTLAERRTDGGWTTMEGCKENLNTMMDYISRGRDTNVRFYRVHNMLNAVVMGYNGQKADASLIKEVRRFKDHFGTGDYDKVLVQAAHDRWDWEKVAKDLKPVSLYDIKFLKKNLAARAAKGSETTRPELHRFVTLLDGAM